MRVCQYRQIASRAARVAVRDGMQLCVPHCRPLLPVPTRTRSTLHSPFARSWWTLMMSLATWALCCWSWVIRDAMVAVSSLLRDASEGAAADGACDNGNNLKCSCTPSHAVAPNARIDRQPGT